VTSGDLTLYDQRKGGMSYQSAQDPRLHFGLGQRTKIDSVEIVWPRGATTRLKDVKCDQIIAVKEGTGIVEQPFPKVRS
jgi:enediyne biosynthesis protein E4